MPQDEHVRSAQTPILSTEALRRLLHSLIAAEQQRLIRKGTISKDCALDLQMLGRSDAARDNITIDEDDLGFDSLSRLDLVLQINRFFNLHTTGVEDYLLVKRRIGDWVELVAQHFQLRCNNVDITFQTSGSTGTPTTVTHPLDALLAEVAGLQSGVLEALPEGGRVIALVPPHHIYGFLFTCLLPTQLGVETIALDRQPPTRAFAKAQPGDLIIATPFVWRHLAEADQQFRPGVQGVTSAGPSDAATWSVRDRAGLASLTEIYGATQTAGIGFRDGPDQDFSLLPHLVTDGAEVRRNVAGAAALDLQDKLVWTGPRHFQVAGRIDGQVQVGGVNVSPEAVARSIGEIAGVAQAHVRLDGDRLKAFVVPEFPDTQHEILESRIRTQLLAQWDPAARPAELVFGAAPPRNEMGKLMDWN